VAFEAGGIFTGVELRNARVLLETDRYRITGTLALPRDGYRSRLTDYLNAAERSFLALTDVELRRLAGDGQVERRPFLALALDRIVLAIPADEDRA
jgi:hypothetical protein